MVVVEEEQEEAAVEETQEVMALPELTGGAAAAAAVGEVPATVTVEVELLVLEMVEIPTTLLLVTAAWGWCQVG